MDDRPWPTIRDALVRLANDLESLRNRDVVALVLVLWASLVFVVIVWNTTKVVTAWWKKPRVKKPLPSPPRDEQMQTSVDVIKQDFDSENTIVDVFGLDDQEGFFVESALRRKMLRRLFRLFDIAEEQDRN